MTHNLRGRIDRLSAVTLGIVVLLVGGCAAAAAATPVSSAVTVAGTVGGPGSSAVIAHPSGGVISKLLVHDGDSVAAGDVLFRLADNGLAKRQEALEQNHASTLVRLARLRAETRGADSFDLPTELRDGASSDTVQNALAVEREKFQTDRANLAANLAEIAIQSRASRRSITTLQAERARLTATSHSRTKPTAKPSPTASVGDTAAPAPTASTTAVPAPTASTEDTETDSRMAKIDSQIASQHDSLDQAASQANQLRSSARASALAEWESVRQDSAESQADIDQIDQQIQGLTVKAPISGVLTGSAVHVRGDVLGPAQAAMQIVSERGSAAFTARLPISDRQSVKPGQQVRIEFTSKNRLDHPALSGHVRQIAAAPQTSEAKSSSFYTVEIAVRSADIAGLPKTVQLNTGAPVQLYLSSGQQTILQYLVGPLVDRARLAFKEK